MNIEEQHIAEVKRKIQELHDRVMAKAQKGYTPPARTAANTYQNEAEETPESWDAIEP